MKKAKVVIGAGYGDEGKGLFTQYYSSLSKSSVAIRFNGGAQAGHTIEKENGDRHDFHHFTSNSFLKNSKSYLSKYFVVNPISYLAELEVLTNHFHIMPQIACHSECYITTPFDILINQLLEMSRSDSQKHGSCGEGFGETIHRNEVALKTFQIKDLLLPDHQIIEKLNSIKEFFVSRLKELNIQEFAKANNVFLIIDDAGTTLVYDDLIERFMEDLHDMKKTLILCVDDLDEPFFNDSELVFEGAQGLQLDQCMGEFPHVTRSNTGLKNVVQICQEFNITEIDVLYATRCYKTRHGAGSLKHELKEKPYSRIMDQTNVYNSFQGSLRFAYLDLDELIDTIYQDLNSVSTVINEHNLTVNKFIGISCLDQTEEVKYYKDEILHSIASEHFYTVFPNEFQIIESWSASGNKIYTK